MVEAPLEQLKETWQRARGNLQSHVELFFQNLLALQPSVASKLPIGADHSAELANFIQDATKFAVLVGSIVEDSQSIEELQDPLIELSRGLIDRGFDEGILEVLRKAGQITLEHIHEGQLSAPGRDAWQQTWSKLLSVLQIPFQRAAGNNSRVVAGTQLFYRGTCKVWRFSEARGNFEDMVVHGLCFSGRVLGIEITSEADGRLQLSVFDVHRSIVLNLEIGPTTPDVRIEDDTNAILMDQNGTWWKLGFATQENLSIFSANLSVAQDCAFSKQESSSELEGEVYDGQSSPQKAGRDLRVWDITGNSANSSWNPKPKDESHAGSSRARLGNGEDMEIAKMLREVLKTKEADSQQLASLQQKMEELAAQINSAPRPTGTRSPPPFDAPVAAARAPEQMAPANLYDDAVQDKAEGGGVVLSTKPPSLFPAADGDISVADREVAGNPESLERRGLLSPKADSDGEITPVSDARSARLRGGKENAEDSGRPYPYTDARYIQQVDVLEDGMPPVPRAICAQQHLEILVLIGEAKHLPLPRNEEEKSHYCAELLCSAESSKTDVRLGNPVQGCQWFHRLSVNVNESELELARDARRVGEDGPALTIHLLDCGRYAGKDVIGSSKILIKDLLDLPESGMSEECVLIKDGEEIMGNDGKYTTISIAFRSLLSNASSEWVVPSLDKTLLTSEGKIVLNPARNKQVSFAQTNADTRKPNQLTRRLSSGAVASNMLQNMLGNAAKLPEEDEIPLALEWDQENEDDEDERQIDFYWREQLEGLMDSLCVNIIVIILVTVDVVNIVLFSFIFPSEDGKEPTIQVALSATVVCCFVFELTLRQLAMGARFWKNKWNIFDCIVVWLSASVIIFKYAVDQGGALQGFQAVVILRIISRIAVGLRVARVLINLRRARKLSGHVRSKLRTTVSQNKRRYKKQGFDLDLTYITNRVIAMATPAFGQHGVYRNDIHVVSRFLSFRHYGCFFVFNLCDTFVSSDGVTGNYNPNMLFNQVQRIPFEDHGPPLLTEILQFCEEAQKWTLKDNRNVIAIHCKGGKGRSGVMISCFILWSGHRKTALDALELFTFRRTENYDPELGLDGTYNHYIRRGPCNQTVEGPSQIRYVHYLEAVLYSGIEPFAITKVHISHMTVPVCDIVAKNPMFISYTVKCQRAPVFDSTNGDGELVKFGGPIGDTLRLDMNIVAWGDVRIELFRHANKNKSSPRKLVAFVIFNPCFYPDKEMIVFKKSKIDVMNKDKSNKITAEDFSITLFISSSLVDSEQLRIEHEFREICKRTGNRVTYEKGDVIIDEEETASRLLLITEGAVEGVVNEIPDSNSVHPLGRSATEACSLGKQGCDHTRVPNISMLGVNAVLGASGFLSQSPSMSVRARSNLVAYEIKKPSQFQLYREGSEPGEGSMAGRGATGRKKIVVGNVELPHMSTSEMGLFYQGLCISLATQLARVRTESIRIGSLKQFNDRQTVLADQDETEKLRVACINMFGLPMNEKLTVRLKCSWRTGTGKPRRVRLLLFVNYLILDPEFFGPEIGVRSELVSLRQLHSVAPARQANVIIVTLLGERVHGLDIAANTINYELTFNDQAKTRYLYSLMSSMCRKAEETRDRERQRPFETPLMSSLLENCSSVFRLKKNERLDEASSKSSLFLVRTGEIRLVTNKGQVFRLVREGSCFGEINFALHMSAGHYTAIANTNAIVLEISQQGQLRRTLQEDASLAARFYCIVSQVIEKELRETMEETFPGSWSRKVNSFSKWDGEEGANAPHHLKKKERGRRGSWISRGGVFLDHFSSKSNVNSGPASPANALHGRRDSNRHL